MKTTFQKYSLRILLLSLLFSVPAVAGDEWSEEDIKLEISYLTKKLLDMSGKDSYTVESEGITKPFIGVCNDLTEEGIAITCITPGSQAESGGLRTGDVVTHMNGLNLQFDDLKKTKEVYYAFIKGMKTGDTIAMKLIRASKPMTLDIKVGSINHPGYSCKIQK